MKKCGLFFTVLILCFMFHGLVKAQGPGLDPDPVLKDTVAVDRIEKVNPDDKVKVDVWLWYDEDIDSLVIPLTFWNSGNHDIFCDSVTFGDIVGGSSGFDTSNVAKKVLLWAKGIEKSQLVPIRREILATIYFHTGLGWDSKISVPIDTTTFQGYQLKFIQEKSKPGIEWRPIFFEGALEVSQVPETDSPKDYVLFQNYPNPFNVTTTIEFSVPHNSRVSLEVYNILGQRIKTLLEKTDMPSGTYRANWDGTDENGRIASSGIYFYRLSIADTSDKQIYSVVRRMVFLK
jgi:hypothetical protein